MTPITRQDILAHQVVVPWAAQYQVEQDLLLCRAMVALFDDAFLSSQIARREGTLLHAHIHEMLGTKMRAMFQRKRGRDLFDLYWALTKSSNPVDPVAIIASFQHYLRQEGTKAGRAEFVGILEAHLKDRGFRSDMEPLLRNGINYDSQGAGSYVKANLLNLLPA
jgi:Nucleotidyl transferase AbiEii toxin, Type IV TA system